MQPIATGWWCPTCEVFESEDEVDTATDICISCGHYGAIHIPVEIVSK